MRNGKNNKFLVVGLGELLWDFLPEGRRLGGAPANFAYHASRLGANAVVVSCIGSDKLGHDIVKQLQKKELNVRFVSKSPQWPTGVVSVELDKRGIPTYIIHKDVAWDFIPWRSNYKKLAPAVDAVCFGSLAQRSYKSRQTIQCFLSLTKKSCLRVFDINLRQSYYDREIIESSLTLANIVKLNDEELTVVANLLSLEGSEQALLETLMKKYNLLAIALTKGIHGSVLSTSKQTISHGGYPVENVVDTVGAGDSFTAALVMGFLLGISAKEIIDLANRLASFVCTQQGAMPSYPRDRFQFTAKNDYQNKSIADSTALLPMVEPQNHKLNASKRLSRT
jgi:fructokinase